MINKSIDKSIIGKQGTRNTELGDINELIKLADSYKEPKSKENKKKSIPKVSSEPDIRPFEGFDYIPSINLYVAREKKLPDKDWFQSHTELQKNGEKMLTPKEFLEYLKYVKVNLPNVYNEIAGVKSPWRAEWLDARFKFESGFLLIHYNHTFDINGNSISKNSELLDVDTLMKDKTPGISLENYLGTNHTRQGLPTKEVKSGDLYYYFPRSDNNPVARFFANSDGAGLGCSGSPSDNLPRLGVRAVKIMGGKK
ncbi:MAG: hypothetical protein NUV46_04905 [Nanoarchaeota archaeon]|nr:hypothetical protein [Nanoarchaeota archaeon]